MEFWQGSEDGDAAQEELAASGLTDGLPVVPPTRARVERMLAHCGFAAGETVAMLPPLCAPATWRDIALNAVMAGCHPEYLPVVGAAVEALAMPEFNLIGIATTTGAAAPLVIVNGPVARAIGMNARNNAFGPGNRANATIGRAVSLALRNIGGAVPGEIDMATLGQPAKYTCCIAENEAESPWEPLSVERGFDAGASVVTVVGIAGTVEVVDSVSASGADLAQTFAHSMLIAGSVGASGLLGGGEPLIVLPPEHAVAFHRNGYTKQKAKAAIWERAVLPLEMLAPAVRAHLASLRADAPPRVAQKPDDVMLVVAGGVGAKALYAPTWSGTTRAVSRAVRAAP